MLRSIGVTGTNGKTTTATWIAAALAPLSPCIFRATTLGRFLGDEELHPTKAGWDGFVEAAKLAANRGARWGVIELTSQSLWAGAATVWPCEVGVFTNLSHDHLDAHGDATQYLACKAQLFVSLPAGGVAVLNACDPTFPLLRAVVPGGCRTLTYGAPERGEPRGRLDAAISVLEISWRGTRFVVSGPEVGELEVFVQGVGSVYAENATAALLAASSVGVPVAQAVEALALAPAPKGRFRLVHEEPWVVLDYAHSPDALTRTVAVARRLADEASGRLVLVFGAGGERDRGKRAPMGRAAWAADQIVLTNDNPRGENPSAIVDDIVVGLAGHHGVTRVLDRAHAIASALETARRADVIVIAGKGHEATQSGSGGVVPFDDGDIVRAWLRKRG